MKIVLELDLDGYKTRDARIITGFVDGTGNPGTAEKKRAAAIIPEGQPGEGGSFVLGQKWTHRLQEFLSLSVTAQENVIGRTKETNIELEGTALPPESHVGRTDIDVDDVPMKMYRRGTPYGGGQDMGRGNSTLTTQTGNTDIHPCHSFYSYLSIMS